MALVSNRRTVSCVKPEPPSFPPELIRWNVPGQIDSDVGEDSYLEERGRSINHHAGRPGKSGNSKPVEHGSHHKSSDSENIETLEADDDVLKELAVEQQANKHAADKNQAEYQAQQATKGMGAKAAALVRAATGVDVKKFTGLRRFLFLVITHRTFDTAIGVVILANGLTIGLEAQQSASIPLGCTPECKCDDSALEASCQKPPEIMDIIEYVFLVIYIIELSFRFIVFRLSAFKDNWVKFDFAIVLLSLTETIVFFVTQANSFLAQLQMLRILRLVRLARAVRLMVQFQVLWQLVQGLVICANVLVWTALLVMFMLYIFALFGMEFIRYDTNLSHNHPYNVAATTYFFGLTDSMLTILQYMCFDSIASIHRPVMHHSFPTFFYFMIVQLLVSVALMNFVTGVMIDTALAVAAEDKEVHKAMEKERKKEQLVELKKMFLELDEDGSGELSLDELVEAPEDVLEQLISIADTEDITGLFELLDYDGGGTVGTDEFCDGVMQSTGGGAPLEMTKMIKQCSDILSNNRMAISILNGKDDEQEEEEEKDEPKDSPPETRKRNPSIVRLEKRCDKLAERICTIQESVNQLLLAFMKLGHPLLKKAVAVHKVRKLMT